MSHSSNHATSLKDTNPHTSHGEVKVDSNRTHHNSMTAVQDKDNTKANVEDNTNETSLVEVRKFKTPRALLPRQPTGEADNESPTTPPNSLKIHGATSSATAKAKITIVACQECQRKKCKCDGERPRCRACARKGVSECVYQDREDTIRALKERNKQLKDDNERLRNENKGLKTEIEKLGSTNVKSISDVMTGVVMQDGHTEAIGSETAPLHNRSDGDAEMDAQGTYAGQKTAIAHEPSPWTMPPQPHAGTYGVAGLPLKPGSLPPSMVVPGEARTTSSKSVSSSTSVTSGTSRKRPLSVDSPAQQSPSASTLKSVPTTIPSNSMDMLEHIVSTATTPQSYNPLLATQVQWQQPQSQIVSYNYPLQAQQVNTSQVVPRAQQHVFLPQAANDTHLQQLGFFSSYRDSQSQPLQHQPATIYNQRQSIASLNQQVPTLTSISQQHSRSSFSSTSNPISPRTAIMTSDTSVHSPSMLSATSLTSYPDGTADNTSLRTTQHLFPNYNQSPAMKKPSPLSGITSPITVGAGSGMHQRSSHRPNPALFNPARETLRTPGYGDLQRSDDKQRLTSGPNQSFVTGHGERNSNGNGTQQPHDQYLPQYAQSTSPALSPIVSSEHYPGILNANAGIDMNNIRIEQYDHTMNVEFTNSDENPVVPEAIGIPILDGFPLYNYDQNQNGAGGGGGGGGGGGRGGGRGGGPLRW